VVPKARPNPHLPLTMVAADTFKSTNSCWN
jgi:hypothetical protein